MPWRGVSDPYKVWVSEIILQQTRVDQGTPYYHQFLERFPDVDALARATEQQVLNAWKGLGYYRRAQNMHHTAREMVRRGRFPEAYADWIQLKGIGKYTAAAIASFCYREPTPVLDGNVKRVVSRLEAISQSVQRVASEKKMYRFLNEVIPRDEPGTFNQAIMELGALVCVPKNPKCDRCPVQKSCKAFAKGKQNKYPIPKVKPVVENRFIEYFLWITKGRFALKKRGRADIWSGLYDLPFLERRGQSAALSVGEVEAHFRRKYQTTPQRLGSPLIHKLSHQKLHLRFWRGEGADVSCLQCADEHTAWVRVEDFEEYPLPVVIYRFLKQNLPPSSPSPER